MVTIKSDLGLMADAIDEMRHKAMKAEQREGRSLQACVSNDHALISLHARRRMFHSVIRSKLLELSEFIGKHAGDVDLVLEYEGD